MKTIRIFLFIAALALTACMPIQPEATPSGTATVPGDAVNSWPVHNGSYSPLARQRTQRPVHRAQ